MCVTREGATGSFVVHDPCQHNAVVDGMFQVVYMDFIIGMFFLIVCAGIYSTALGHIEKFMHFSPAYVQDIYAIIKNIYICEGKNM